ncbi:lipoyl(octanoyl) transferase [Flavipsychrobacter stenotrophus]|uniref:Octanoyltransferase n=1 Tax=Flavipsychrobacter stenotrophus TaxID=2077091 RepID=A0A2S7T169_9BACT|nr:lipoyl(octanoyl) transferase LipB [Flavipsychrobacter stenotrophus]PQJ12940.1 lipoyl(octanoyl) transferase [Flavipsychrobacter stenotrophus]
MESILFQDLGNVAYDTAWDYQEQLMKVSLDAKAQWYNTPELERLKGPDTVHHLLFCEHPHVYTIGKSGHMENLLVNNAMLKELNVSFFKTNRGGDITYHGPGQIVGYPILDLERFFTDLGRYMRNLEEVMIRVLATYGIVAGRLPGSTGVWLDADVPGKARKICAMGVKCSRWVTIHGFALNVNTDLNYFNYIVPCGITDKSVTSLQKELGRPVDEQEVKEKLVYEFGQVFGAEMIIEKPVENVVV